MTISFRVDGEPQGKQRPRFVRATGRTYTPQKTVDYERKIWKSYVDQTDGAWFGENAVKVEIIAYYAVPKSAGKTKTARMLTGQVRPTKKPDADNIVKAVCDALNRVAYQDDSQVVDVHISKVYALYAGLEVSIKDYVEG